MKMHHNWWKWLIGAAMTAMIALAFLYAPTAKGLGQSTRILFFHVPCAWVGSVAFLVSAIYSGLFLKRNRLRDDIIAASSAEIGFIFTILATITGSIWAKEIWHSYWNWDPRQTSIFILLLIYAAYFALRSAIEDESQRARLAAVYSIIAFVTVPFFTYIAPRIYDSLHPDPVINARGKIEMDGRMQQVFWSAQIIFTFLYYWILRIRADFSELRYKFDDRKFQVSK